MSPLGHLSPFLRPNSNILPGPVFGGQVKEQVTWEQNPTLSRLTQVVGDPALRHPHQDFFADKERRTPWPSVEKRCSSRPFVDKRCCPCSSSRPFVALSGPSWTKGVALAVLRGPSWPLAVLRGQKVLQLPFLKLPLQFFAALRGP